jgi:nucleotide-binding universal stress UspA family protein
MTFRKILCPVDLSEPSREALKTAARLAADANSELTLLHVWQSPVRLSEETILQSGVLEHEQNRAEAALAGWKAEADSLGAKSVAIKVLAGVPWKVIVDEVASHPGYDLVVLGTHGRTGIMRVLLGSVAERVARHADCPVLLVRSRATR